MDGGSRGQRDAEIGLSVSFRICVATPRFPQSVRKNNHASMRREPRFIFPEVGGEGVVAGHPAVALARQADEERAAGADFVEAELEGFLAGALLLGDAQRRPTSLRSTCRSRQKRRSSGQARVTSSSRSPIMSQLARRGFPGLRSLGVGGSQAGKDRGDENAAAVVGGGGGEWGGSKLTIEE